MRILDFFNMKSLLLVLLAQKLISSKCVLVKNNLLPSDTVPLIKNNGYLTKGFRNKVTENSIEII